MTAPAAVAAADAVPAVAGTAEGAGAARAAGPAAKAPAPKRPPTRKTTPTRRPNPTKRSAPPEGEPAETPDQPASDPPEQRQTPSTRSTAVHETAGFVLGVLLFGWVVMPFIEGGPAKVKALFLAKFTNKAPDGTWLP